MRKQYKQPMMNVVDMSPCMPLASSLGIDKHSQGDFSEDFVKGHRGTWGDLWGEDN